MKHATHCQFCKMPITVEADDSYAALGDPFKLLPLAACNQCADLRVSRRRIEAKVRFLSRVIQMAGNNATDTLLKSSRETLTKLTQDYAKMIARWNKLEGMAWDEECVNQIMDHPERWGDILSQLWKTFRQSQGA